MRASVVCQYRCHFAELLGRYPFVVRVRLLSIDVGVRRGSLLDSRPDWRAGPQTSILKVTPGAALLLLCGWPAAAAAAAAGEPSLNQATRGKVVPSNLGKVTRLHKRYA